MTEQPTTPISHAEMIAALRFAIQLAKGESFDECADDLRAVLAYLERTQPTDAQADLTARARNLVRAIEFHLMRTDGDGDYPESTKAAIAALQSEREAVAARTLFVDGEFAGHSGGTLPFKIDCDALSDGDIATLAAEVSRRFKFCAVYGVPRGGNRLAQALQPYCTEETIDWLIVDDVFTTGRSMEETRAKYSRASRPDPLGVVIFARGPCPSWITPLFATPEASEAAAAEARRALENIAGGFIPKAATDALLAGDWHPAFTALQQIANAALASPPAPQEDKR